MFYGIDPLAERYQFQSPYVYAANNPIRYIDWMGMAAGDPPVGTTQIYLKVSGSFGPQLGLSFGEDILNGSIRGANVIGETKIGLTITPEGKKEFLFEQSSKNVNYELKGDAVVIGGSKSSEYGTKEHPSMAVSKKEVKGIVAKKTTTESDESINVVESINYEIGLGVNALLVGLGIDVGFEHIESSTTETKPSDTSAPETPQKEKKETE
jgi:hypothetical protein